MAQRGDDSYFSDEQALEQEQIDQLGSLDVLKLNEMGLMPYFWMTRNDENGISRFVPFEEVFF